MARRVDASTLVLGSTQPVDLVAAEVLRERGVELLRRRGGGGCVFLRPGDHVWIDAWIPRGDPLWQADVSKAAAWAGAWWIAGLEGLGLSGFDRHVGRAVPGELGALVCFAGRGPGEVFWRGRKVMGLSQWRSREGALFSTCAYSHWQGESLVELLRLNDLEKREIVDTLGTMAVGTSELDPPLADLGLLQEALLSSFPQWGSAPN
jgi:lipoate-protein ligase A